MENRKILLVDESNEETHVQNTLEELSAPYSLQVAQSASEALSILMGGNNIRYNHSTQQSKGRPDVILVNDEFLQNNGVELLDVIRKYYSLKNIPIFIVGSKSTKKDPVLANTYGIAGYLSAPKEFECLFNEPITVPAKTLSVKTKAFFAAPVLAINNKISSGIAQFFKTKALVFQAGHAITSKMAVAAGTTILAGSVITVMTPPAKNKVHKNQIVVQTAVPFPEQGPKVVVEPTPEPAPVAEVITESKNIKEEVIKVDVAVAAHPPIKEITTEPPVEVTPPSVEYKIKVEADPESETF